MPDTAKANTFVDGSPTLTPLDMPDLPDIAPAQKFPPGSKRRRSPLWKMSLAKRRGILTALTVGLFVLIAATALFPLVRDRYSAISNGGGEVVADRSPDADGWIDLLSQVNTGRDAVAGQWQRQGHRLAVNAAVSARLVLPFKPPREYDFEVEFTRQTGVNSVALHFIAGDGQASYDVDGWEQHLAGIQNIDGRTIQENSTRVENQRLLNGRSYSMMVRVRRDYVDAFLDGKRLTTYRGDGSNLSMLELWRLPDPKAIGIGAYDSATTFHRIRVRPAGGSR